MVKAVPDESTSDNAASASAWAVGDFAQWVVFSLDAGRYALPLIAVDRIIRAASLPYRWHQAATAWCCAPSVGIVVDEPYFLQAAMLQVRQGLRHNLVVGELVHRDMHFWLR